MQILAEEKLVNGFDYDSSGDISTEEKFHKHQFPNNVGKRGKQPLGHVHSDVCGKIPLSSLSKGHYFLTFIDDNTEFIF